MFVTFTFKGLPEFPAALPQWCQKAKDLASKHKAFFTLESGSEGSNPHIHGVLLVEDHASVSRKKYRRRLAYAMYGVQDVPKRRMLMKCVKTVKQVSNVIDGYLSKERQATMLHEGRRLEEYLESKKQSDAMLLLRIQMCRDRYGKLNQKESLHKAEFDDGKVVIVDDQQRYYCAPYPFPVEVYRNSMVSIISRNKVPMDVIFEKTKPISN